MAKRKPSKVSKKGASASNANTKYWSSYSIDKLIQQCKSRQIPVPTQKLKRQEYIHKIEDNLAKFADKGPRDWSKLTVEDLKNECNLRSVDATGLKKQDLVEKLGGGKAKDGGTEPTASRQTGPPASNDQQKQDTSPGNADRDYDNWNYRSRLLPAWKTLGIKSRKAVDIIQALKDRDQKEASQGGAGAPAPDPPSGTPEKPTGNGSNPAASRSPPGQGAGQQGAATGGTLDSPTFSIGSDFQKETAPPDPNRPVKTAVEALEAARSDQFSQSHGLGLSNPSHLCYRNVVMVMLLHCNRLLSWIENRHIPNLEEAGFILKIQLDREDRKKDNGAYTDVWCELLVLAYEYWHGDGRNQTKVDKAMKKLWRYLTSPERQIETAAVHNAPCPFRDETREHDVPDLLEWLIDLSVCQLACHLTEQGFGTEPREEILNKNVKELMTVYQSVHYPCQQRRHAMHRKGKLDEGQLLRVEMPPDRRGRRGRAQQNLTLEQCLEHSSSSDFPPCSCAPIAPRESTDEDSDAEQTPTTARNKIWYTPEVLFVQLKRFRAQVTASGIPRYDRNGDVVFEKDMRRVEIPTELDLGPFLNKKGHPDDLSTKYNLVGIICHQGTRNGGHYTASIRRGDNWQEFDDSTVKKTSLKAVMEHKRRFTPYVLMYERIAEAGEHDSVSTSTQDDDNDDENNDANGNAGAGPGASGDGQGRGAGHTKGANDANRASNRGNKLGPAANNDNSGNGANNPAGNEALQGNASLFTTPYVQKMLGSVFNKIEKHIRKEAQDQAIASSRDVFMDHFFRREADMFALQQEQAAHIDRLVSYATLLEDQKSQLMDIVSHTDPAALGTFLRKRRHEETDDDEIGTGRMPPSKRSKHTDGHTSSMDVATGHSDEIASDGRRDRKRSIYDVHGSASRPPTAHDEFDTELPDYVTSEEEALDETDSQSAPMSESDTEDDPDYEDEHHDQDEAATQAQIAAAALESYRANRLEMILDDGHLAREHGLAKRAFADNYADEYNIVRGQGPWSWMGPQHQQHFEAQLQDFLDDWEERALDEVDREKGAQGGKFAREGWSMPSTPTTTAAAAPKFPAYSPRSPRYSDMPATDIKVSPSRRFYSIGRDSNSVVAGTSLSNPSGISSGGRTMVIKSSPRSNRSRSRILTPTPTPQSFSPGHSFRHHDGHRGTSARRPTTPATPAEQDTWFTPAAPRRRTPRSFNPRFHPGFGRVDLASEVWPLMQLEKHLGPAPEDIW